MISGLTDRLTGLPTRSALLLQLEEALAAKRQFVFIYADVDNLKSVNDRFGIWVGDQALRAIGGLFAERFRGRCSRFGGQEFAAICECWDQAEGMIQVAAIELAVRELSFERHADLRLSITSGTAFYPLDATTVDGLLRHADRKLYERKRDARGSPPPN